MKWFGIYNEHEYNYNLNISEKVRASAIMQGTTFKDFDICQRMTPLRKLHQMTLKRNDRTVSGHVNLVTDDLENVC